MELMLDTANLQELDRYLADYPAVGVTSNPSILKKEGGVDLWEHLRKVKALCGEDRSLHVQVVADSTPLILQEARRILAELGEETYIKIPVTPAGLPAVKSLSEAGANVTATAVYTSLQGMMAVMAGAKYIAVYFSRIEKMGGDPERVIRELVAFIDNNGFDAKVLAASFHEPQEVSRAYAAGAHSATVAPSVVEQGLSEPPMRRAVQDFTADFEAIHGPGSNLTTV